ncbi:MAG: hypothetical protein J3Q66DRAFT_443308 [Benniella sp.]|nr:MAG: hypothetical protein J3Q66DRAFT_443308 [Benniella sp.]
MLDLPELLDKVCQLLVRDDLMRCALVSNAWHSIVIPHLWRDLSWISSRRSRDAFRMLVLEDYLAEQQRRERRENGQDIQQSREPLLSNLNLNVTILSLNKTAYMEVEPTETGPNCWTALKELSLQHCPDTSDTQPFWSWLWKRCGQVERLKVYEINGTTQSLAHAMFTYMPNLREITLGYHVTIDPDTNLVTDVVIADERTAQLLSGSRNGWRVVSIMSIWKSDHERLIEALLNS